jgi:hypothetical protein
LDRALGLLGSAGRIRRYFVASTIGVSPSMFFAYLVTVGVTV